MCKAASRSQTGFGGNRISLVGDMLIAGENAKLLIAFKQVSVETESYWLETGLFHANIQAFKLFLISFSSTKNLIR